MLLVTGEGSGVDMATFLCWRDSRLAVVVAASITLGLSLFYLAVAINLWAVAAYYVGSISAEGCVPGDPCNALVAVDGVVNIMAISVAMEVFALLTSAVALYGIAKNRRSLMLGWIVYMPVYILYQLATVILMIINLQSITTNSNSLPAVFSIYSLLASGASSLAVQTNSQSGASAVLSHTQINAVMLPFVSVIIFWFIQVIINSVNELAAVKWYRSDDSRPYYNYNYNSAYRQPPPSKNDLMTSYPAPYMTYPNMGYAATPAPYRQTVPVVTARPYYTAR